MKQENTLNLDNFWIPFTGNKAFKAEPRLLVEADGMYYTSDDDKKILDGIAGMWCCNAGHCHPHIVRQCKIKLPLWIMLRLLICLIQRLLN